MLTTVRKAATEGMRRIMAPSILAADFKNLGQQIKACKDGGAEYLHIDVMDGVFVPQISFGMPVIKSIRPATDLIFDVHLMIVDPLRYIDEFARCGADIITFHLEAAEDPRAVADAIHNAGKKCGISIRPGTPVEDVFPYADVCDMILVMTVEPGFGGQKFIEASYDRIRTLRKYLDDHGHDNVDIEVDGGVRRENLENILAAGANVIVAGSAVFSGDVKTDVEILTADFALV